MVYKMLEWNQRLLLAMSIIHGFCRIFFDSLGISEKLPVGLEDQNFSIPNSCLNKEVGRP